MHPHLTETPRPHFHFLAQVVWARAHEIQEFLASSVCAGEGWSREELSVELNGIVHTCSLWMRDMAAYVRAQYGSRRRGAGFVVSSRPEEKDQPWGGAVWAEEEAAVRARLGAHAVIAALQLYSDATLVNFKNASVHPVYATLLNR